MAKKYLDNTRPLSRNLVKKVIHQAENDANVGVINNGQYYVAYPDGVNNPELGRETLTIGDGVSEMSNAPKWWFSGQRVPAKDVDNWTYDKFVEGDVAVRKAYDDKYGTPEYPHPSDTLGIKPRLGVAQVRYQQYRLGKNTDLILDALKTGNDTYLKTALYIAGKQKKGGSNRLEKVNKVLGNNYYK